MKRRCKPKEILGKILQKETARRNRDKKSQKDLKRPHLSICGLKSAIWMICGRRRRQVQQQRIIRGLSRNTWLWINSIMETRQRIPQPSLDQMKFVKCAFSWRRPEVRLWSKFLNFSSSFKNWTNKRRWTRYSLKEFKNKSGMRLICSHQEITLSNGEPNQLPRLPFLNNASLKKLSFQLATVIWRTKLEFHAKLTHLIRDTRP